MSNESISGGKWTQLKGDLLKAWGNITGDEFEKFKGNVVGLAGLVEQKYGMKKDDIMKKINGLLESYKEKTEESKDQKN